MPSRGERSSKSLLRNQSESLFSNGFIRTTLSKAKVLRPFAEKLITKAIYANKEQSYSKRLHLLRTITKHIKQEDSYLKLVNVWAIHCFYRPGGYLRITKLGKRQGDGAEMAMISMVLDENLCNRYSIDINKGIKYVFPHLSKSLLPDPIPDLFVKWRWNFVLPPEIEFEKSSISEFRTVISISFNNLLKTNIDSTFNSSNLDWNRLKGNPLPLGVSIIVKIDDTFHNHLFFKSKNVLIVPKFKEKNKIRFLLDFQRKEPQEIQLIVDLEKKNEISTYKKSRRSGSRNKAEVKIMPEFKIYVLGPNDIIAEKKF